MKEQQETKVETPNNMIRYFENLILVVIVLTTLFNNFINAQEKDNLSQIYFLADSSVSEIVKTDKLSNTKNYISVVSPENYKLVKNRILFSFEKSGITSAKRADTPTVVYSIDKVGVIYLDAFRDGWFGSYLLERQSFLKASIRFPNTGNILNKDIYYSVTDTVDCDNIKSLENPTIPFTHSDVPAEPLFSSLFEPIIAIGTVVVTVLLLFNVRSK